MSDIFKTLEGHLRASTLRHGVIASNIANVDTPGYKARDVKFDETLDKATIELRSTQPGHMTPAGQVAGGSVNMDERPSWGDQNNVELDMEVAKMTENAVFFQAATTILSKNIQMYKAALRRS
ncbi:MAG: flagellar basal body rod protein FlgB [Deltaproteobacteria bacterium]|nr:flagellar basal body rod protein FlgB [Deltaproteobacteria bacterium]